jgi:glucose/arabinose dehydrogenase
MNKSLFYGLAVIAALSFGAQITAAQQTRELRTIRRNNNDTATVAPTIQRIKSLKLPAGFSIAKYAEIADPRMLAVAPDGTVYVSQRSPGTLSMLKDTNGDGVTDLQTLPSDKPHGYHFQIFALDTKLNLPSGFNRQALLDAMKG